MFQLMPFISSQSMMIGEMKHAILSSCGCRVRVLWARPVNEKPMSASDVRVLIAKNEQWDHMAPAAVARVIRRLELTQRIVETRK